MTPDPQLQSFKRLIQNPETVASKYLLQRAPKTAVDVGCGDSMALYFLHHDYGVDHLIGLDTRSSEEITEAVRRIPKPIVRGVQSMYDIYTVGYNSEDAPRKEKLTEDQFNETFSFRLGRRRGQDYHGISGIELIVCSNVMHYLSTVTELKAMSCAIRDCGSQNSDYFIRIKEFLNDGSRRRDFEFEQYEQTIKEVFQTHTNMHYHHDFNTLPTEGRALIATSIPLQ